jgi:hypothetical protein
MSAVGRALSPWGGLRGEGECLGILSGAYARNWRRRGQWLPYCKLVNSPLSAGRQSAAGSGYERSSRRCGPLGEAKIVLLSMRCQGIDLGHRVKAALRALPVGAVAGLDQGEEPGQPGDDPGVRRSGEASV